MPTPLYPNWANITLIQHLPLGDIITEHDENGAVKSRIFIDGETGEETNNPYDLPVSSWFPAKPKKKPTKVIPPREKKPPLSTGKTIKWWRRGHWIYNGDLNNKAKSNAGFIYKITDTVTDQIYVGKKSFWKGDGTPSDWRNYCSSSSQLVGEISERYQDFKFEILEIVKSEYNLGKREQHYLGTEMYKQTYNIKIPKVFLPKDKKAEIDKLLGQIDSIINSS